MTVSATPAQVLYSPNHGGRRQRTLGVILHSTRSGRAGVAAEYGRTTSFMLQLGTVSSHRVIGTEESQHAQMVEDDLKAWHAEEDNAEWLSIEFSQPTPSDRYTEWQIETGIAVVVAWHRKYNLRPSTKTIKPHSETPQGKRNGKSDPGDLFPIERFIQRVYELLN